MLYTNVVEPILRWKLVERGCVLVHAACFAQNGNAWLLTARTDTGKTTTMLKLLAQLPVEFLSDDLTLLTPDGEVLTYPKPLTISRHTVHALGATDLVRSERLALKAQSRLHSREGRRAAFLLTRHRLPVASLNAVVQRLVPPPKYHVERLVPGVALGTRSHVAGLLIIERGGTGETALPAAEALAILLANCDDAYGFPPYATLEHMLLAMSPEDLRAKERELIQRALGFRARLPLAQRVPRLGGADPVRPGGVERPVIGGRVHDRLMTGLRLRSRTGTVAVRFGRFGLVGLSGLAVNTAAMATIERARRALPLGCAARDAGLHDVELHRGGVVGVRDRRSAGRPRRLLAFFAMNNAAFLVRGPIILLLTEYGHLDPVVSNVISLVLMTVARFIVADTIIWQERTRPSTTRSVPVGELRGRSQARARGTSRASAPIPEGRGAGSHRLGSIAPRRSCSLRSSPSRHRARGRARRGRLQQ